MTSIPELLDLAEEAFDTGDLDAVLALCEQVHRASPDHPGAHYLRGEVFRAAGVPEEAELAFRAVIRQRPDHSASFSGIAGALFDQLRFDEARTFCLRALRSDDGNAEAYYWRAMLRERRDDFRGARRDYRRAAALDPTRFPLPEPLDDAMVEAVVADVLLALHPTVRAYLAQVVFLLEEVPDEEVCLQFDPPAPPGEILGLFSGTPLTERSFDDPWSNMPATILLYRRNLERIAWDRGRLLEELRITVFHEVGHFLGLDEDDLAARGLD